MNESGGDKLFESRFLETEPASDDAGDHGNIQAMCVDGIVEGTLSVYQVEELKRGTVTEQFTTMWKNNTLGEIIYATSNLFEDIVQFLHGQGVSHLEIDIFRRLFHLVRKGHVVFDVSSLVFLRLGFGNRCRSRGWCRLNGRLGKGTGFGSRGLS